MKSHSFTEFWCQLWRCASRRRLRRLPIIERLEQRLVLTNILFEGFEGSFPADNGWSRASSQGRIWDDNLGKHHTGNWSGFAADLADSTDQTSYVNNMSTSFSKVVDLSNYRDVTLEFWRFLNTEPGIDGLTVSVFKNGVGSTTTTMKSGNFQTWTKDTVNVPVALWGQSGVTVQFNFVSDSSVISSGTAGVWVDDISLDGTFDPGFPKETVPVLSGTHLILNQFGDLTFVSQSILSFNEVDVYAFGIDISGSYTVTAGQGSVNTQLRLYGTSGQALTGIIDNTTGTESVTMTLSSGSTLYVAVGGFSTATGTYDLTVNGPSSNPLTPTLAPNTFTGNDTGSIDYTGDRDYFSFTAPTGTNSMNLSVVPNSGLDVFLAIFDASGQTLQTRSSAGSGSTETFSNFAVTAGQTYTLVVAGQNLSEGSTLSEDYSLTVDFGPDVVLDSNVAPVITFGQIFPIPEFPDSPTLVGKVLANDANTTSPNNTITYSIVSGSPSNPFTIDPSTGEISIVNVLLLDFEQTTQFLLQVKATDGGNLSDTKGVVVSLTDVNESPFLFPNQVFSIAERAITNALVGTVLAGDPDTSTDFNTLTFEIFSGNTNNAFKIDPATGLLRVNTPSALDFGVKPTFTMTIIVTDGGGLFDFKQITVNLTDVNEAPVITGVPQNPAPVFVVKAITPVSVFPAISVTDPDNTTDLATLVVRIQLPAIKKNPDIITLGGASSLGTVQDSIANGFRQVTITLNSNTTTSQIETFLRGITFSTRGGGASKKNLTRQFQVSVTDKHGLTSNTVTQVVNVRKK